MREFGKAALAALFGRLVCATRRPAGPLRKHRSGASAGSFRCPAFKPPLWAQSVTCIPRAFNTREEPEFCLVCRETKPCAALMEIFLFPARAAWRVRRFWRGRFLRV